MKPDWREYWFGIKPPKTRVEKLKALEGQRQSIFLGLYVLAIPTLALDVWGAARYPFLWGFVTACNLALGLLVAYGAKKEEKILCKIKRLVKN